ncbi:MAG: DUF1800 family protein [Bacteroidota bacterium]
MMELFTLGRGNYTESDIKEAARAFTGWGSNLQENLFFVKASMILMIKKYWPDREF